MRVEAKGIVVWRGGRLALTAPDFTVEPGEAAVLRGPNGAGKSTLLRALAGLAPFTRGSAVIGAHHLPEDRETVAGLIAYAGHLDAVKPALTVRENLTAWAAILGAEPARADAAMERFSLSAQADTPVAYCSAGQKRRAGLARLALMERPVWLLDEPTVSLDAATTAVFADMVSDHCAKGGVAIAATHIDLGLPDGPLVEISPPVIRIATEADPFLSGDWK